jgi:hypothetical protein
MRELRRGCKVGGEVEVERRQRRGIEVEVEQWRGRVGGGGLELGGLRDLASQSPSSSMRHIDSTSMGSSSLRPCPTPVSAEEAGRGPAIRFDSIRFGSGPRE